jgi:peroxiredoxin
MEPRRIVRGIALIALTGLMAYSVLRFAHYQGMGSHVLRPGTPVAPFSLPTLDGGRFDLSQAADRPVVITFWGPFCPSCKRQLPDLQALHEARSDDALVVTVAQGDRADVEAVARRMKLTLPVLLDERGVVHHQFNVFTIPYNVVLAPGLTVKTDYVGAAGRARMEAWIARAPDGNGS